LRARTGANPGRPLALALGSSRLGVGLRPATCLPDANGPVLFNCSLLGAGAVRGLVWLPGLFAGGGRPDLGFLGGHPALLGWQEERWIEADGLDRVQLDVVRRYLDRPGSLERRWYTARLFPSYTFRSALLTGLLPEWGRPAGEEWLGLDRDGWWAP